MSKTFQNLTDLGGLVTDRPEDKIPQRNASDLLNIDFSSKGLIQTKRGYDLFGNEQTGIGSITRMFLYKKNYGTLKRIKFRVRDDGTNSYLEWLNPSNTANSVDGEWEQLVGSLTTGALMGFAAFNNSNANLMIFCNAVENFSTWNGATGTVASVTSNTIVINETIATEGFSATGSVTIDGTDYAYTGTSGSTFTGVTPNPSSGGVVANQGVAQKADTSTYSSLPKCNIFVVAAARLWASGRKNYESTLYYSKVGDATNFTAGNNPDDPGFEDFPDGGGPITLLDAKDNAKIIIHKEDAVLLFTFEYTATAKVPILDVLTLAEDSGASNQRAGAGLNSVSYFTTKTEGLKSLARALEGEDLVLDSLTDTILPTIDGYDLSEAATVFFAPKRAIYVACKSSPDKTFNDRVIAFYIKRSTEGGFVGDISIDHAPVADWLVDDKRLFFASSVDQNVYEFFTQRSIYDVGQNHHWTSKEFTFDEPAQDKDFNIVYLEGLIGRRTKIKVTVLYGILGSQGSKEKIIAWDDSFVSAQKVSALGADVVGVNSLGASSDDIQDSFAFAVPIHVDSNRTNRYKISVSTYYDEETDAESYWAISNLSTNPNILGINQNTIVNSNV